MDPIKARHAAAVDFARDVTRFAVESFRERGFRVDFKDDASPVTKIDRKAERMLRDAIAAEFPDDAVLGEEFGETAGTSPFRWVIDPIDGTRPFIHGAALWGTLIGVLEGDRPVVGVCGLPSGEVYELYHGRADADGFVGGIFNHRAFQRAKFPVETARAESLSEATVLYTQISLYESPAEKLLLEKLVGRCRLVRGWGDCWGHMAVADGRADVMIDTKMNLWDAAALLPIVESAGCHYRDLTGKQRIDGLGGVSLSPAIEEEFFALVRECGIG